MLVNDPKAYGLYYCIILCTQIRKACLSSLKVMRNLSEIVKANKARIPEICHKEKKIART